MVARHSNGNWVGGTWHVYELHALFGCCFGEHHPLEVEAVADPLAATAGEVELDSLGSLHRKPCAPRCPARSQHGRMRRPH